MTDCKWLEGQTGGLSSPQMSQTRVDLMKQDVAGW